jgi:predicted neuraminidase
VIILKRGLILLALSIAAMGADIPGEFIFTSAPFPSCHASTVVELKNGDVMASWFGGTDEGKPDVAIWASRRSHDEWSAPVELAREPNIATYNPVLFHNAKGRLWLYYKFGPHPDNWTAGRRFSDDEGKTWSAVEHLPAGIYGPIRAKPLLLDDGTIVSGTSVESYRMWTAWIEKSLDGALSWKKFGPVATAPGIVSGAATETTGLIQPSVVRLAGGKLRMYARATRNIGRICIADSADGGNTWTAARPLELPNPNSGIDAVALKDGRVVVVYNHTQRGRSPLNLAVSGDGEHFQMFQVLESDPGEYSYPALIQGAGGGLHLTYTWKRTRIRYRHIPLSAIPNASKP